MDGNQTEIKKHKKELIDTVEVLKGQLRNLNYTDHARTISDNLAKMNRFQELRK